MNDTRRRIHSCVVENAGVHFNELVRRTDGSPGQVQHHLQRLLDREKLVSEKLYGKVHYYPPEYDEWERKALALLQRDVSCEIITRLLKDDSPTPSEIADSVDIARSSLEYHLERLIDCDVVEKEYGPGNRVLLGLSHPEQTEILLVEVTPQCSCDVYC
ncbi:winged helix-turn-helix transcriptional regulator [Natronobacterium gregoryi]|nr:winged helix-turn-helix transcriptional regulator [Natronobacterium gregoryi]